MILLPHHVVFDTLKFVETLTSAGMPREQAKACVEVQKEIMEEAFENNFCGLATERELISTKSELKADIAQLRSELTADIAYLRSELKADIAQLRSELTSEISVIKKDVAKLQVEMVYMRWMLGTLILGVGSLVVKAFI